ncbi:MAG: lysylphosphatidylglycerol synthase transmembrane domain-containing protein [Marinifilaceae bacterium]
MNKIETDDNKEKNLFKSIRPTKVIYPIVIGLAVVSYMLYNEFDPKAFDYIVFTKYTTIFLSVALLCMMIRDFGYVLRLRILTDGYLTWTKALRTVLLWEFTSAVTPSAIGGTSIAILFVHKEGISVGKSSAVVMATSFLDELYFIIMFPLILLAINHTDLWNVGTMDSSVSTSLIWFSIAGYSLKLIYLLALSYGLFVNPRGLKWILLKVFKLPLLRKWKHGANTAGTDIINNSKDLKAKKFSFWLKAFAATFFSWTARYWIVNAILAAFWFSNYVWADHFLIFARQLVMWIMQLVSPTPGGSGFAEYIFSEFLGQFLPTAGLGVTMAVLWRLITYYPYLFAGVFLLPSWIKSKFGK